MSLDVLNDSCLSEAESRVTSDADHRLLGWDSADLSIAILLRFLQY